MAMTWAQRLKRVFGIDIAYCVRRGGKLQIIASIEQPRLIATIRPHVMKAHVGVDGRTNEVEKAKNRNKSRVRAKVEHVFGVIKNIFGFRKTRYRGLAKNLHRLEVTAALANLYIVRRRLLKA